MRTAVNFKVNREQTPRSLNPTIRRRESYSRRLVLILVAVIGVAVQMSAPAVAAPGDPGESKVAGGQILPIVAGDTIYNSTHPGYCTVGAVLTPGYTELALGLSLNRAMRWLVTSGHCGETGDQFSTGPGGAFLGSVTQRFGGADDYAHDFLTIRVPPSREGSGVICNPTSTTFDCTAPNIRFTPRALAGEVHCRQSRQSPSYVVRAVVDYAVAVPRVGKFCGGTSQVWQDVTFDSSSPTQGLGGFSGLVTPLGATPGDSGGPVIVSVGGQWKILGINHGYSRTLQREIFTSFAENFNRTLHRLA